MKAIPILFKADMVGAILDGNKTMTRRLGGLEQFNSQPDRWRLAGDTMEFDGGFDYVKLPTSRYGVPGDRLWVKETWGFGSEPVPFSTSHFVYRASGELFVEKGFWKNAMFMPRRASRITLEIVNVCVERVQDILDTDVLAEGLSPESTGTEILTAEDYKLSPLRYKFACLWESITGRDGWNDNPWVWVITFKKITP